MFGNIENLIQRATDGQLDPQAIEQAASDHLSQMDSTDAANHLQDAANSANQAGQPGVAQALMSIVEQHGSDPEALKAAAIAYIKSNPQVLTHFAPSFAQGILNRVL